MFETQTSIMVRNLRADFSQALFVHYFIDRGYGGLFDFVYVPMNFRNPGRSFGYGFVNFRSHEVAVHVMTTMTATQPEGEAAGWIVAWSSCQGFVANVERLRNSSLMHELVPPEYKPAVYDALGNQVAFPLPTKCIPKPRVHGKKIIKDFFYPEASNKCWQTEADSVGEQCQQHLVMPSHAPILREEDVHQLQGQDVWADHEYTVSIHQYRPVKSGGKRLGLDIERRCKAGARVDDANLVVEAVNSGLIEDWNNLNPDKAVAKGHRLVEVNGVRGLNQMLYECSNASKLSMIFSTRDRAMDVTDCGQIPPQLQLQVTGFLAERQAHGFPPEGGLCDSRFPPAAASEDYISADQHVHAESYWRGYSHGKGRKSWPSVSSFEGGNRNITGIHGKGKGPHRMSWPTYMFDEMHGKGAYPWQGGLFYSSQLGDCKGNLSNLSVHEAFSAGSAQFRQ